MTLVEEVVLQRIKEGRLRLTPEGRVEYYHSVRRRWYVKTSVLSKRGRRRYHFHIAGRKSGQYVYASRLTWMLVHKQHIPHTHYVDHKDENRKNDRPSNLQLMPLTESNQQGGRKSCDMATASVLRFFEFIIQHGREPISEVEVAFVETGC